MKHTPFLLVAGLALVQPLLAQSPHELTEHPAYLNIEDAFDFQTIKPAVNINLPRFLMNSALAEFNGGEGDPIGALGFNLKELTQDVKLIRVVVLEANPETKEAIAQGVSTLRAELDAEWTPIVSVPKDNVFIYARSDAAGQDLSGLALLVADGNETVIGNLVGNVPIGKIARIAARMGSGMMPAEVLQALGHAFPGHGAHAHGEHADDDHGHDGHDDDDHDDDDHDGHDDHGHGEAATESDEH